MQADRSILTTAEMQALAEREQTRVRQYVCGALYLADGSLFCRVCTRKFRTVEIHKLHQKDVVKLAVGYRDTIDSLELRVKHIRQSFNKLDEFLQDVEAELRNARMLERE